MSKFLLSMAFAGLIMAGTAVAADVAMPAPAFDWSGAYVGLDLGAAINSSTWSDPGNAYVPFNTNGAGFAGGGIVGFRHQMNNLVLGIEGSADVLTVDGEANCTLTIPTCVTKESFLGMLQGNIGFASGRIHLYGTGGVAFGSFEHFEKITVNQSWGGESRIGWTAGAGIDYAISSKWVAGARWNYYDFGNQTLNPPSALGPVNFKENGNLITARLEYKF